jgi:hypothetical protein
LFFYHVVFEHEVEDETPEGCEVNVEFPIRSRVGWGNTERERGSSIMRKRKMEDHKPIQKCDVCPPPHTYLSGG